jgi:hypothetical protein
MNGRAQLPAPPGFPIARIAEKYQLVRFVGSIAFGAIVGAAIGIAFWYFYSASRYCGSGWLSNMRSDRG